jgi:hypothetical protein
MAYANNYTYMYGFSLLDDLHNFFPEILYDETLFPDQRFGWFRHRTSTLFPSVFSRQINTYRIYNAAERQNMFNSWINSQAIGIQTQPPTAPLTVPSPVSATTPTPTVPTPTVPTPTIRPIATLRYATPSRTYSQAAATATTSAVTDNSAANILMRMALDEFAPQTPQRPPSAAIPNAPARPTRRVTQLSSDIDILNALLTIPTNVNAHTVPLNSLNSLLGTNDLLSLLTNSLNFQDVLVIPTMNQIDAASRIIEHADVAAEENCAICQEHTIPGQQSPWRRLHCSHQFHTSCIMPWFQRDVHCPVCRADIRDLGAAHPDHDDHETQSNMSTTSTDM